jgi:predicted transposase YdaD
MCETGSFTDAEMVAYDYYLDIYRTQNSIISKSKKRREDGRAKGFVEGELQSLINIVLNCRRNGLSMEQIQAITGLGEERVLEIFMKG